MLNVGLLYTKDDKFGLDRSELLLGCMRLEKINFVRFISDDIHTKGTEVDVQEFIGSSWIKTKPMKLDVILDCTIPNTPRVEKEKKLLSSTVHTYRIDYDKYQLLDILSSKNDFEDVLLEIRELNSYEDLVIAQKLWDKVAIKVRTNSKQGSIMIVSFKDNLWFIDNLYESYSLTTKEMKKLVEEKLKDEFFLQQYEHSVSTTNRAIAFNIVVQQRYDGSWLTPAVRGIISTKGSIASLKAGSEFIGTPLLMEDVPYFNFTVKSKAGRYTNLKLQKIAISIAQRLEEIIGESIVALGVRFVIDKNLNPKIITIEPRTNSQSGPGRHLEFYKHITELVSRLSEKQDNSSNISQAKFENNNMNLEMPSQGITFRSVVSSIDIENISKNEFKWFDLSIGHGGRQLIMDVSKLKLANKNNQPFFSFKIGNALNDRVNGHRLSIIALEDYLGQGLLSIKESEYMRSLRIPLLEKQISQASPFFKGVSPDIIWLEDIDLCLFGLDEENRKIELEKTFIWLENLCIQNKAKSWGVVFFNPKTKISKDLIVLLKEYSSNSNYFKYVATRMETLDIKVINTLIETTLKVVILSNNISYTNLEENNITNVGLLNQYKRPKVNNLGGKD